MNTKNIVFVLLLFSILFLVGCSPKTAGSSCISNEECLSKDCVDGVCSQSQLHGGCNSDYDCSEGMCKSYFLASSYCSTGEKGDECKENQPKSCPEETICHVRDVTTEGKCMPDTLTCKSFHNFSNKIGLGLFIGTLIIVFLIFGIGGGGIATLLGVPVLTSPQGWTFTLLGSIIIGAVLYFHLIGVCF